MTVYAIYNSETGDLVSIGRTQPETLRAGLTAAQYPDFDPTTHAWSRADRTFIPFEQPVVRTPEQQLADVRAVLAEAASFDAPVLAEAVIDLLARAADAIGD